MLFTWFQHKRATADRGDRALAGRSRRFVAVALVATALTPIGLPAEASDLSPRPGGISIMARSQGVVASTDWRRTEHETRGRTAVLPPSHPRAASVASNLGALFNLSRPAGVSSLLVVLTLMVAPRIRRLARLQPEAG